MNSISRKYQGIMEGLHIYDLGEIRVGIFPHAFRNNFFTEVFYQQLKKTRKGNYKPVREGAITDTKGDILAQISEECIEYNKRNKFVSKSLNTFLNLFSSSQKADYGASH